MTQDADNDKQEEDRFPEKRCRPVLIVCVLYMVMCMLLYFAVFVIRLHLYIHRTLRMQPDRASDASGGASGSSPGLEGLTAKGGAHFLSGRHGNKLASKDSTTPVAQKTASLITNILEQG